MATKYFHTSTEKNNIIFAIFIYKCGFSLPSLSLIQQFNLNLNFIELPL